MADPAVLIIDSGDPPSLAAHCLQRDPSVIVQWIAVDSETTNEKERRRATDEVHAVLGTAMRLEAHTASGPMQASRLLVDACAAAAGHGCRSVVWPIRRGPDSEAIRPVLEIVDHVAGLIAADTIDLTVELPLLDLTEAQVLDLIRQNATPLTLCWPFCCPEACSGDESAAEWLQAAKPATSTSL